MCSDSIPLGTFKENGNGKSMSCNFHIFPSVCQWEV